MTALDDRPDTPASRAASVIAAVLGEWRRQGLVPPADDTPETALSGPLAVFCAEPHPIDPGALCRRLADECDGTHNTDGREPWTTDEETPDA